MSDHKKPQPPELIQALKEQRLPHDKPSQLADSFRHGWQAARRAQVVSVQPTSKQVVLGAAAILGQPEGTADNRDPNWKQAVEQAERAYLAMLAAAPQPPECLKRENPTSNLEPAPVQMPEPVAYLHPDGTCASTDEYYGTVGWTPLYTDLVRQLLDAAPKPPETAPVQMPEAQAEVEVRSMKTYLDLSIHEWSDTLPDGCYKIYTEHQVLQLLADHGIK